MNILYIDQLELMARIGVHNWEKKCLQKLVFDLKISFDQIFCIYTTNISEYLDYSTVIQIIQNVVRIKHFLLIEDIAEVISMKLMNSFFIISKVQIKVSKPGAVRNARNVGVYIERNKLNNLKKFQLYTGWKH